MKFILAAAAVVGLASARPDSASIRNNCKYPIYVQSIQFGGQPHGNPISVPPGGKYYEPWNNKGVALKVDKSRTFDTYLEFDYSTNTANNYGYYRFKNADGKNDNPFSHEHNVIDPGNGCKKIDCRPGDANCYKRPTEGCPKPLDIVVTICSK